MASITGTAAAPGTVRPRTVPAMILEATRRHSGVALSSRRPGEEAFISYAELGTAIREIAGGLIALGIQPGDRISILSGTRPEWTLADFGSLCAGAVVAPIYHTNSPEECRYVLGHAGARVVFCEDEDQVAKVERVRADCPDLDHVVAFRGQGAGTISLAELRNRGREVPPAVVEERAASVSPEELATIVYTSGTTGPPKGCMATHANLVATAAMYEMQLDLQHAVIYMFLPLAHSLARMVQLVTLGAGGNLAFWCGDAKRVLQEVREVRPTHFPSVPRIFEKIHAAAMSGIEEGSPAKRLLARWALGQGRAARARRRAGRAPSALERVRWELADRLVLSNVRDLFGGELKLALTGAAPIGAEILEFFDACGLLVLEGYGMTETCAAATLNTPGAFRFGTVGRPLPETQVRIASDGEILMAGPNVFQGYYRDAAATAETLQDGWIRSGDLGELTRDGYLRITGRKKDLIITSSGKNISPTNIENELREIRWISEAVVYGDKRPYLVAAVTLDPEEAVKLAERLGVGAEPAAMARDERVREDVWEHIEAVNQRFATIEQIKKFAILERELSQVEGELTPTLKVKRAVVCDRYRDVFEAMYL